MVLSTLVAYLVVYAFLLVAYVLVLMYMAQHPAMPTPEAPQSAESRHAHRRARLSKEPHMNFDLGHHAAADLHGRDGPGAAGLCGAGRLRPRRRASCCRSPPTTRRT